MSILEQPSCGVSPQKASCTCRVARVKSCEIIKVQPRNGCMGLLSLMHSHGLIQGLAMGVAPDQGRDWGGGAVKAILHVSGVKILM